MPDMVCPRCWGSHQEPTAPANPCLYCAGSGRARDTLLSAHFRLSELLASETAARRGIPNDPSAAVLSSLSELCTKVLEPLREEVGPLHVNSGYRAVSLNIAIGGAAHSAHVLGAAADLKPLSMTKRAFIERVRASRIPFDQVIYEYGSWVHVGHRGPNGVQRREALMIFADGKGYRTYDPTDARVT
jgi:zinc D-Ala-D-Ala carboxypeptidase